jgi:hypothetical protein
MLHEILLDLFLLAVVVAFIAQRSRRKAASTGSRRRLSRATDVESTQRTMQALERRASSAIVQPDGAVLAASPTEAHDARS